MTGLMVGLMLVCVLWLALALALGTRDRALLIPLLIGGVLRVGLSLLGQFAITLPYSSGDAVGFERSAWRLASQGWGSVLDALNPLTGFSYTAPFAAIYAIVGREPVALLLYNQLLALLTIALVYRIGRSLGDRAIGLAAAYAFALFPATILMAAVVLREASVAFGVALCIFGLVESDRLQSPKHLLLGVAGLGWASLHHGGVIIPGLAALVLFTVGRLMRSVDGRRVHAPTLAAAVVAAVVLTGATLLLAPGELRLASVGVVNFESVEQQVLTDTPRLSRGGSDYYGGTTTESWGQAVRQFPGRVTLFMLSPLPWTVRSATQMAGLLDGLLWGLMLILAIRHRSILWGDPRARVLLVFVALAVATYALGTTNAGTALRHRTKFAPALIPLLIFAVMTAHRRGLERR